MTELPLPWTLRVYGIPLAQARARSFVPKGWTRAVHYDPNTSKEWKQHVAYMAAQDRPARMFTGPVFLGLTFYLPRPKSAPARVTMHTSKPDEDNLGKAVKDAIRGIVYCDDSQIVRSVTVKAFAGIEGDTTPGVIIEVFELPGEGTGDRARAKRMAQEARTPPAEASDQGRDSARARARARAFSKSSTGSTRPGSPRCRPT